MDQCQCYQFRAQGPRKSGTPILWCEQIEDGSVGGLGMLHIIVVGGQLPGTAGGEGAAGEEGDGLTLNTRKNRHRLRARH